MARSTHSTSIAVLAYDVAASSDACQSAENALKDAGYNISYTDLKVAYPGSTVATDVERMKQAGSNFVLSCMDVQGNISMARAIKQYDVHMTQLWLNGNDQSTLNQNQSLMQGIYFSLAHVPFGAPHVRVPRTEVVRNRNEEVRAGIRQRRTRHPGLGVGRPLRAGGQNGGQQPDSGQRHQRGQLLDRIHGGWADIADQLEGCRSHRPQAAVLHAYIKVSGDKYVPTLNKGKNVFACFDSVDPKKNPVYPLPAGTPAPA